MAENKIITENDPDWKPPKPKPKKNNSKKIVLPKIDPNKTVGQILDDLENDKFVCYYCDKIFMGLNFLQNHRKRHCDENGNLPCRLCKRAFETYKLLSHHVTSAHQPRNCKDCNKTFQSSNSLSRFSFVLFLHYIKGGLDTLGEG